MKVCAISDIHGQFALVSINPSNILFICGDIVPLKMQRNIAQSLSWFKKKFIPWCEKQPVDHIYMVGGNHDFFLEKISEAEIKECLQGTKITILYNEYADYIDNNGKIWSIWGSPLCHQFGNWAFMHDDEYNKSYYELMPENVDFLITHDAAYEHSDQCLGFMSSYERELHRGNVPLKEIVEQKQPSHHLFGHLHTCLHEFVDYNGTKTACVSLLNENYDLVYEPLYFEVE